MRGKLINKSLVLKLFLITTILLVLLTATFAVAAPSEDTSSHSDSSLLYKFFNFFKNFFKGGITGHAIVDPAECPANTVSYWTFDDSVNPGTDYIGTNDGTINGATWTSSGLIDGAMLFDGTGDYIDIADNPSLDANLNNAFTIALWYQLNEACPLSDDRTLLGKWYTGGGAASYVLFYDDGNCFMDFMVSSDGSSSSLLDNIARGNSGWQHVVVGYNGTDLFAYHNGSFIKSTPYTAGIFDGPQELKIGRMNDAAVNDFNGLIDEVIILDRALDAAEIQQMYTDGIAGDNYCPEAAALPCHDAVSYWTFEGGSPVDIIDGNDGILNGTSLDCGKVGESLYFDGDDSIDVGNPANLNFGATEDFTLSAWVKTVDLGTPQADQARIISKQYRFNPYQGYRLYANAATGHAIAYSQSSQGTFSVESTSDIRDGNWHHLVVAYDRSSEIKLYVDGVLEDTHLGATDLASLDTTDPLWIGGQYNHDRHFKGNIDEVAIFGKVLDLAEVQQLYADSSADKTYCGDSVEPCTSCTDTDTDGYGVCPDCGIANGCTFDGDDCLDTNTNVNPGAVEICDDGVDNDCDGDVDSADSDCIPEEPVCTNTITLTSGYSDDYVTCTGLDCVMTQDLNVCTGNGIVIGADDITLDCAGHKISGNDTNYGILENAKAGALEIRNCEVTNFQQGIRLTTIRGSYIVENNKVHDVVTSGILLVSDPAYNPSNNIVRGNNVYDISLHDGYALLVQSGSFDLIENNTINKTLSRHSLITSTNSDFIGNTLYGYGVQIIGENSYVADNNIRGFLEIRKNTTAFNNAVRNILTNADNAKVINNRIVNGGTGVRVCSRGQAGTVAHDVLIEGNTIINQTSVGVEVGGTGCDSAVHTKVINNYILGNDATLQDGIRMVEHWGNNTLVANNTIIGVGNNAVEDIGFHNIIQGNYFDGGKSVLRVAYGFNSTIFNNTIINGWSVGVSIEVPATFYNNNVYNNYLGLSTVNTTTIYHNNIYDNTIRQISSPSPMEVSYLGEGNFWGRTNLSEDCCIEGVDTTSAIVDDSFCYYQLNGWLFAPPAGVEFAVNNVYETIKPRTGFTLTFEIENTGTETPALTHVVTESDATDIPFSVIGPGSEYLPLSDFGPGDTANITVSFNAEWYQPDLLDFNLTLFTTDSPPVVVDFEEALVSFPEVNPANYDLVISPTSDVITLSDTGLATSICEDSKKTLTITNNGSQFLSDVTVSASGTLADYVLFEPGIEGIFLAPGESREFNVYLLINDATPSGSVDIVASARLTPNAISTISYTAPGGVWAAPVDGGFFAMAKESFICVNHQNYSVTFDVPTTLLITPPEEAELILTYSDACMEVQPFDTDIYFNTVPVANIVEVQLAGEYIFDLNPTDVTPKSELEIKTSNYLGSGHYCANAYNALRIYSPNADTYCGNLVCDITESPEESCSDGEDNDCDGLSDCLDMDCCGPACYNIGACLPPEDCTNGIDDDGDNLVDCADTTDCCGQAVCELDTSCRTCSPEDTFRLCTDGIDNDCDGMTDSLDIDSCLGVRGADNDFDGYCAYPKCGSEHGCVYEKCDCDDFNPDIHPYATEVCNLADDNCNLIINEHEGDCSGATPLCDDNAGICVQCIVSEDCDDDNACTDDVCAVGVCSNTPNDANSCDDGDWCTGTETCSSGICIQGEVACPDDGIECTEDLCDANTQTCNYQPYDEDGDGSDICEEGGVDCNDDDNTIYPGAPELCDAKDNDCDGSLTTNENEFSTGTEECDGFDNDCDGSLTTNEFIYSTGKELCSNTLDDDCDGDIDVVDTQCTNCITDVDLDNYFTNGAECGPIDCNDNDNEINPGHYEICNDGKDNDCDGETDVNCCINPITLASGYSDMYVTCTGSSCVLNQDVGFCENGFDFAESGITLDCNSYTLAASTDFLFSKGIGISNVNDITIKNCNVEGFSSGLVALVATNLDIDNNNFRNNLRYGIYYEQWITNSEIRNNVFLNQDYNEYSTGVFLRASDNNKVLDNVFTDNTQGLYIHESLGTNVSGNQFSSIDNNIGIFGSCPTCNIWQNEFYGTGIQGSANFCLGVGNYYENVAPEYVPSDDCGPTPAATVYVNKALADNSWSWNAGTATYKTIQDALNNVDVASTVEIISASGPYNENVFLVKNATTLDCKNEQLIGDGSGEGIYMHYDRDATAQNCDVQGYTRGIYAFSLNFIIPSSKLIRYNTLSNNAIGVYVDGSNIIVDSNTISDNLDKGVFIKGSSWRPDTSYTNSNIIKNNVVTGHLAVDAAGIFLDKNTHYNEISGNTVSNNYVGVISSAGIASDSRSFGNIIDRNTFSGNTEYALSIAEGALDHKVFCNSFANNEVVSASALYNFNVNGKGNYWDSFDSAGEGCVDSNNDKICDSAYLTPDPEVVDEYPQTTAGYCASTFCPTHAVSYWTFDDEHAPGKDDFNGNDGIVTGAESVSGKVSNALSFDGNDYVNMGDVDVTSALTVAAWVNPSAIVASEFVSKAGNSAGTMSYRLKLEASGAVSFGVSGDGSSFAGEAISTTILQPDTWYHVVGVFTPGSSVKVYVDGMEGNSDTSVPVSIFNSATPLTIGANGALAGYFNGAVDEVAIFDRALTMQEIEGLYGTTNAGREYCSAIKSYPPLQINAQLDPSTAPAGTPFTVSGQVSTFKGENAPNAAVGIIVDGVSQGDVDMIPLTASQLTDGTFSSFAIFFQTFDAAALVDGINYTQYATYADPAGFGGMYIGVDLGSPHYINEVKLLCRQYNNAVYQFVDEAILEISNDDFTYIPINIGTSGIDSDADPNLDKCTLSLDGLGQQARYLKIKITDLTLGLGGIISELQVIGVENPLVTDAAGNFEREAIAPEGASGTYPVDVRARYLYYYGETSEELFVCIDNDGDGVSPEGGDCGPIDCDDNDPENFPGNTEICDDGKDNDCDNLVDTDDEDDCAILIVGTVQTPEGIFEPENAGLVGTHLHTFNINFTGLTAPAGYTISCDILKSDDAVLTLSKVLVSELVDAKESLVYTIVNADAPAVDRTKPWVVQQCMISNGRQETQVVDERLYTHLNTWTAFDASTDDAFRALDCFLGFGGKYFDNQVKCDYEGDVAFALSMSKGVAVEGYCHDGIDNDGNGQIDCDDRYCKGISYECITHVPIGGGE